MDDMKLTLVQFPSSQDDHLEFKLKNNRNEETMLFTLGQYMTKRSGHYILYTKQSEIEYPAQFGNVVVSNYGNLVT